MDDSGLDPGEHRLALAGLARLDRAARAERLLWPHLKRCQPPSRERVRVLDLACGGGEPAVPLLKRARRAKLRMALTACDRSQVALEAAAERARAAGLSVTWWREDGGPSAGNEADPGTDPEVQAAERAGREILETVGERPMADVLSAFVGSEIDRVSAEVAAEARLPDQELILCRSDVLAEPPAGRYDVVMCSLFLHHLADDQAIRLLASMRERAQQAVLVQDLRRSRRGWLLARLASRLLTRSDVVRYDALRSVEGAFTAAELGFLAGRAGLNSLHTRVDVRWPERLLLAWERP
jgi:SAM-dependent methyltransferase